MKALSIRQPWASLIINGPKRLENRPRRTHFRGWCLVHASSWWTDSQALSVFDFCRQQGLIEYQKLLPDGSTSESVRAVLQSVPLLGGIIGAIHITDCITESPDPWFIGPFAYVIDRVISLPFTPCKGRLGFFEVDLPPEIQAQIPA